MPEIAIREKIRRVRLGDARRLIRYRCGAVLPEDDAGEEYLIEMLKIISLGTEPERKMLNAVETFAPFMDRNDANRIIAYVNRIPAGMRWPKPHILGESLRLTNAEREGLGLWSILPCDVTQEDLAEQRKRKERERKRRKRKEDGHMTREEYRASVASQKPWIKEGVSRATWFRRKAETGSVRTPQSVRLGSSAVREN
jgi:hypothetical protein